MSTVTLDCNATGEFNYSAGSSWTQSGGQVHESNAGTAKFFYVPTAVSTPNHKTTIVVASEGNSGYYHDCIARKGEGTENASWDGYDFYTNEVGAWGLVRFNSGSLTATLASGTATIAGSSWAMELQVEGTGATVTLNAWLEGVQVATNVTDTTGSRVLSGNHGSGAGFGELHIDQVIVTDVGAAVVSHLSRRRPQLTYR